jgi:hypothetical protein
MFCATDPRKPFTSSIFVVLSAAIALLLFIVFDSNSDGTFDICARTLDGNLANSTNLSALDYQHFEVAAHFSIGMLGAIIFAGCLLVVAVYARLRRFFFAFAPLYFIAVAGLLYPLFVFAAGWHPDISGKHCAAMALRAVPCMLVIVLCGILGAIFSAGTKRHICSQDDSSHLLGP